MTVHRSNNLKKMISLSARLLTATLLVMSFFVLSSTAKASEGYGKTADISVFAPKNGDLAGVAGRGFVIDLRVRFDGDLASTGASIRTAPPGGAGAAADFPGLVVLLSSSKVGAGAGQNLANLFNLFGVTDRDETLRKSTDLWGTWVIAAAKFGDPGTLTRSRLLVAIVDGRAPSVVTDQNGDGVIDEKDLELMGFRVISDVVKRNFTVNGF